MADILNIEDGVLKKCTDKSVTSVVIPSSVTAICDWAFRGCSSLSSVVIPSSVTAIGGEAFRGCTSLSSVVIPEGVTAIGESAFSGCKSLSSVEIPSSVTEIGKEAFKSCESLASVEFGGTVAQWKSVKGKQNLLAYIPTSSVKCSDGEWQKPVVLVKNGVAVRCLDKNVKSVTIPEGVTEIGGDAFYCCKSLESVVIPEGVTKIGGAFLYCESLASVVIPSSVTEIGEYAFLDCTSLSSVEFGGTVAQLEAVNGKENLCKYLNAKSVKCSDGEWQKLVVHVENGVALECLDRNATSVTIPEGVTEIGEKAFEDCKALASVVIPEGVTEIGKQAFWFCESLSSVVIPSSVTAIGERAFEGCESLSSVEFGGTAEEWEDVEGKRELLAYIPASSVKFSDDEEFDEGCLHVKNGVLEECTDKDVKSVVIPESVTEIGEEAFKDCTSLSSVEIPSSVTAIGEKAFYGCKSLSSVKIPLSVRKIGKYAFMNCNINKLSHPALVRENGCIRNGCAVKMREKILYCASQITSVTIPEGVTEIGEKAFYGCESLASVVIPSSVKKIGNSAFDGCKSLASVEIPSSVTEIGKFAFNHCNINELSHPLLTIKNGVAIKDNEFSYLRLDYLLDVSELPAVSSISEISDNNVFYCASQSTSVTIPEGVTKIGREAFKDCTSLLSVEIPSSVTEIGVCAFECCTSLESVEFGGTVAQWEAVEKGDEWHEDVPASIVKCADGEARL